MSALDRRHPSQARYRRNLRRALVVATAVHAVLFAVVPGYTASPAKSERDLIRMVDARPWRSREPWPEAPGSGGKEAGAPSAPPEAAPEPVRMESGSPVETLPARSLRDGAATLAPGPGGAGSGGQGAGFGEGDEPPVFYAYDTAPRVLRRVEPLYPPEARDQGLEGTVVLHVNLDARGRIQRAWVARSSGAESLVRAAMDAIYQFEFEAGRQKEAPVPCTIAIPFEFHLDRVLDDRR